MKKKIIEEIYEQMIRFGFVIYKFFRFSDLLFVCDFIEFKNLGTNWEI